MGKMERKRPFFSVVFLNSPAMVIVMAKSWVDFSIYFIVIQFAFNERFSGLAFPPTFIGEPIVGSQRSTRGN